MSNNLLSTTTDFLSGITGKLYSADGNDYNMYSYAYLQKTADGFNIENDDNPAVESLDDFPVPDGAAISIISNDEAPYIGTAGGKYFALTDCSGYVIYIIAQTSQDACSEIVKDATGGRSHSQPWPSAAQYANYSGGTNWTQVLDDDGKTDFSLIEAGDIIAWDESGETKDTGHVMIAIEASVEQADGSYQVKISDSTVLAHKSDQRNGIKKGNDATGVGTGFIGLKTDGSDLQSNFYPGVDPWITHPHINILRLK